jgi:hypothetical protein
VQIIEIKDAKLAPFPETDDPNAKEGDAYLISRPKLRTGRLKVGLIITAVIK